MVRDCMLCREIDGATSVFNYSTRMITRRATDSETTTTREPDAYIHTMIKTEQSQYVIKRRYRATTMHEKH